MEKKLDLCVEPAAYFQERVELAMTKQGFETIQVARYYLVDLLNRFVLSSNLFDKQEDNSSERETLAVMFLKAQNSSLENSEKIRILKKLGDTSLYISGFFGDSLNRKVIDLEYYREMGSIAYRSLSGTIRDDQFQRLYGELHDKFTGFVNVLTEVSQGGFIQNNQNLLRLYDVYVRTGSESAKKQLEEKGLPVVAVGPHSPDKNSKN